MHALNDTTAHSATAALRVEFRHEPLHALLADPRLLAVFGFGDAAPATHDDPRYLHVALPAHGDAPFECWRVEGEVAHGRERGIAWSTNGALQFGALEIADAGSSADIETAAAEAYARLRKRANQPLYRRLANEFGDWGIAWGTGYQVADSQSGQRLYPAAVCALGCSGIPGEDFVFEAQIVMSAAQQLGTRCVSVPIEARYNQIHGAPDFRPSHFRPLRDLWRITSHIVLQCLRRGGIGEVRRSIRAHPPVIDDTDGEFSATIAPRMA